MRDIITTMLFILVCLAANAQDYGHDIIFFENQKESLQGYADVDYKQGLVLFRKDKVSKKQKISFNEIDSLKLSNGRTLTKKMLYGRADLMLELIKGKNSLLLNQDRFMFYIEQNDTLKIINKKHINLALPVIFGRDLIDEFVSLYHIKPRYSAAYLKKLTTFSNKKSNTAQIVKKENFKRRKQSFKVAPYFSLGINSIAIKPHRTGIKSKFYDSQQSSVGLKFTQAGKNAIDFEMDIYQNAMSHLNLSDSLVFEMSGSPGYLFTSKLLRFNSKNINLDGSVKYTFFYKFRRKVSPYLFIGPSFVIVYQNTLHGSLRSYHAKLQKGNYSEGTSGTEKPRFMVGGNGGLGLDYFINSNIVVNVFLKYQPFIYPTVESGSKVNHLPFFTRFNLSGRSTSIGLSLGYWF
ncbi:hypothetical protein [Dyadobacter aurulentus]|uniref:hypothetical protein n=1 Tax=Dyadobacter sp. UC 10 TaxID=2605428 RepID=UPI0011F3F445|nr:hypothetical protein [Dyadobacter sp. UC 10]KAA0992874.1 hypothetical protein FXO21_23220 [Dyadobacter sp. UC 10]